MEIWQLNYKILYNNNMDNIYINGNKCLDIVALHYLNEGNHAFYYTAHKNIFSQTINDLRIQDYGYEIFLSRGKIKYKEMLPIPNAILYHGKIVFDKVQVISDFSTINMSKMIGKIKNG